VALSPGTKSSDGIAKDEPHRAVGDRWLIGNEILALNEALIDRRDISFGLSKIIAENALEATSESLRLPQMAT
jgi:hypothetical protein